MYRFAPSPDRRVLLAAIAAATLLSFSVAFAEEPQVTDPKAGDAKAPVAPASALVPGQETAAPAPAVAKRPLSPMLVEMQAVLAAEHEQLAALHQRVAKAATNEEAVALQRDIEKLKFDTEVSLLRVQAKHARQAGRNDVAARIEAAVSELLNPPKIKVSVSRPVPTRENPSR